MPGVARFLRTVLEDSGRYQPFLVSLAMSSRDGASVRALDPGSWLRGVRVRKGRWEGRPYVHVGARLAELEFMRYAPRRPLTDALDAVDLIQVVAGSPCWLLPAAPSSVPVLLLVATLARLERRRRHEVEGGPVGLWRRGMTALTERLDVEGLRRADRIFVLNRWMERHAHAVVDPERVVLAPPGVDVDRSRPRGASDDRRERDYILSVARFDDPRKNAGLLFGAYARLAAKWPSAPVLWLAGSSPPPESAWRIARKGGVADRIRYLGKVSDEELARLYRNALFFVLSSDEEGFGLVLAEAMASGVPVVSTACGGPEDIITDGEDGFLVPRSDPAALAGAMARLLKDPELRRAMGVRARRTAVTRFSLQVAGERYLAEYDAVMRAGSDPGGRPTAALGRGALVKRDA